VSTDVQAFEVGAPSADFEVEVVLGVAVGGGWCV